MGGRRATSAPVPTGCTQGSPGVGTGRSGAGAVQGRGWAGLPRWAGIRGGRVGLSEAKQPRPQAR